MAEPRNPKTAIITDSSSQLDTSDAARLEVSIVPITITIDGVDYREGVDIGPDEFYARLGPSTTVTTSQPSPSQFLAAFEAAESDGADEILAVLVGSGLSGAIDSCRVAAELVATSVTIVDTGTSSYGVSLCVKAAAAALGAGATVDEAAAAARVVSTSLETVFILQGVDLARGSGRFSDVELDVDGTPVIWSKGSELEIVATVTDLESAVAAMASRVAAAPGPLVVASGLADAATRPVTDALEERMAALASVVELTRYRVGPSIGAHTGPGTAGVFYHPA